MPKQTSIEWLLEQVPRIVNIASFDILEQAKAMEKEEIVSAYRIGNTDDGCKPEKYYQETYGGNNG